MTQYFLGIDWGKSKIGIALADNETRLAFAHSIIKNDASVFDTLRKIIKENDVDVVIIGMPSGYMHATDVGGKAKDFGERVAQKCQVDVEYFQEMFTTKMAQSNLIESGRGTHLDDQEAARLILQEWLDSRK